MIRTRRGPGKVSRPLSRLGQSTDRDAVGDGFKVFDLPPPLNRTVLGICMGKRCLGKVTTEDTADMLA
jgi:hypothetical protein